MEIEESLKNTSRKTSPERQLACKRKMFASKFKQYLHNNQLILNVTHFLFRLIQQPKKVQKIENHLNAFTRKKDTNYPIKNLKAQIHEVRSMSPAKSENLWTIKNALYMEQQVEFLKQKKKLLNQRGEQHFLNYVNNTVDTQLLKRYLDQKFPKQIFIKGRKNSLQTHHTSRTTSDQTRKSSSRSPKYQKLQKNPKYRILKKHLMQMNQISQTPVKQKIKKSHQIKPIKTPPVFRKSYSYQKPKLKEKNTTQMINAYKSAITMNVQSSIKTNNSLFQIKGIRSPIVLRKQKQSPQIKYKPIIKHLMQSKSQNKISNFLKQPQTQINNLFYKKNGKSFKAKWKAKLEQKKNKQKNRSSMKKLMKSQSQKISPQKHPSKQKILQIMSIKNIENKENKKQLIMFNKMKNILDEDISSSSSISDLYGEYQLENINKPPHDDYIFEYKTDDDYELKFNLNEQKEQPLLKLNKINKSKKGQKLQMESYFQHDRFSKISTIKEIQELQEIQDNEIDIEQEYNTDQLEEIQKNKLEFLKNIENYQNPLHEILKQDLHLNDSCQETDECPCQECKIKNNCII